MHLSDHLYLELSIDKFVNGFVHNKTSIKGELAAHKSDEVPSKTN